MIQNTREEIGIL